MLCYHCFESEDKMIDNNSAGIISNLPVIDVTDFIEIKENWVQKHPQKGDHIRVKRIGGLLSRKYDKNGMLILKEEDFIF